MNILNRIDASGLDLGFILVFLLIMIIFALANRRAVKQGHPVATMRSIRGLERMNQAIASGVEAGGRLHISLGRGNLTGVQGASALLGLSMLHRITRSALKGDRSPIATSGEGIISILSRDTLISAYHSEDVISSFDPASGQLTGVTTFSYAAGTLPLIHDEGVSASFLAGHFGPEAALIAEAGARAGGITVAGSDHLPGQAVLFATAQEAVLGEELFASGAYLKAGSFHVAGVQTQDVFRWILILAMVGGALLKVVGVW